MEMSEAAPDVLLVSKGHPFQRDPFFAIFDAMEGITWTHVEQPAARLFFRPEHAEPYDAIVLYDMPGISFRRPDPPEFPPPPTEYVEHFHALLEKGQGFVFLHHAIAGWPGWPEYADIIGGRFLYQSQRIRGRDLPDSGYRFDVKHRVSPLESAAGHAVVAGLDEGFEIEDEVYLIPVFEEDITPLMRSDHQFVDRNFYSSALSLKGRMNDNEGWSHPQGSNVIAWVKRYRNSPIAYIQCGHGPAAYANEGFQRLLANAIRWVASEEAVSGSLMAKQERISPWRSGTSRRSCCSDVPKSASSPMLPVSGAEQLVASGASSMLRPMISARGA